MILITEQILSLIKDRPMTMAEIGASLNLSSAEVMGACLADPRLRAMVRLSDFSDLPPYPRRATVAG